jgi:CP family cyanate transporter-like MFS transporter
VATAILLIAFNLRLALANLSPVLPEVMHDTGLTASGASLLSMVQVLCLGLFAAAAPFLVRRVGLERAALVCILAVTIGSVLRGFGDIVSLSAGGVIASAGIGAGNVVLPGLLKRDFSDKIAAMSGLYSMILCLSGAVPSGATAPLRIAFGDSWAWALEFWAAPALIALVAASFVWRNVATAPKLTNASTRAHSLWRDKLAWQVTMYMGLQSLMAYSVLSWMAPILRERGDDAVTAGVVVAVSLVFQVAASLPAPIIAARLRNQSLFATGVICCSFIGFCGLIYLPLSWQWACSVLMGIGMGGSFGLAQLFMVMRTPNADAAARLSSMAQAVGYSIASLGPLGIGLAHDATGDWFGAILAFAAATAIGGTCGFFAGRNRLVRG